MHNFSVFIVLGNYLAYRKFLNPRSAYSIFFSVTENILASQQLYPSTSTLWPVQIITKSDGSLTLDLLRQDSIRSGDSQKCGKLKVHAEECVGSKTTVEMILRCSDLEYRDLFSKSVCAYY